MSVADQQQQPVVPVAPAPVPVPPASATEEVAAVAVVESPFEREMREADEAAAKAQAVAVDQADVAKAARETKAGKKAARRHGRKSHTEDEQEARYAEAAAALVAKKEAAEAAARAGRPNSKFTDLRASLTTAADVAAHIRTHTTELGAAGGGGAGDRELNLVLQCMSSSPTAATLYETFASHYRAETLWVLDRLVGSFARVAATSAGAGGAKSKAATAAARKKRQQQLKKSKLAAVAASSAEATKDSNKAGGKSGLSTSSSSSSPLDLSYAHEFVLRVGNSAPLKTGDPENAYDAGVGPMSDSVPLPVLTAVEMISDFIAADPEGHVRRALQLAAAPSDVASAIKALEKFAVAGRRRGGAANGDDTTDVEGTSAPPSVLIGDAPASALLGQAMSKVRRLCQLPSLPKADKPQKPVEAAPAAEAEKVAEVAAADSDSDAEDAPKTAGVVEEKPAAPEAAAAAAVATTEEPAEEEDEAPNVDAVIGAPMTAAVLAAAQRLCVAGGVPVPPRAQHFLDWAASAEGLIGEEELPAVESLLAAVTTGVEQQAKGMEAVLTLKTAATREELREALAAVSTRPREAAMAKGAVLDSDDEEEKQPSASPKEEYRGGDLPRIVLTHTTPDIISALGVAGTTLREALATAPSDDGEVLCRDIRDALMGSGVKPLPRRAQRFIDGEARRERQLDPKRPRLVAEEEDEGEEEGGEQRKPPQPLDQL